MPDTPTFSRAAIAAPHQLAAEAGRTILAEGGNALEAMIATAATIAVVYPHMNAIGGDSFWIVREPGGRVHALEGCGPAGSLATIARYRDMGFDAIPAKGPNAAVTVAGTVGGWRMALELARALGGKLPLDIILGPAIQHAREGYAISASEVRCVPPELDAMKGAPGFAETFLIEGRWPKAGERRTLPRLADTLEQLAHAGLDDFYRGDVAREIAADLEKLGAPVTRADLKAFQPMRREPLAIRLKDATIYNTNPPTQGLAALIILGLFDRLGVTRGNEFDHVHGLVEATKRAFAVRDRYVTDFDHLARPPAEFLEPDWLDAQAQRIDVKQAAPYPLPDGHGDTVWLGATDGNGLTVSTIQSVYWEYGSGCVLPATGIHWQNRGASFSLDPSAVNPLQPGRRPFHTLCAALAAFDDGRTMAYGSMGGDGQPQFQASIFTRVARFGMALADAVDAPRWLLGRTWGATHTRLKMENRFDPSLIAALRRAGHDVDLLDEPYSDGLGHAGGVLRHANGRVEAMHDPRSDGGAAGL